MRWRLAATIAGCVALTLVPDVWAQDIETSHGALLGTTVIHWSGIKGITLDTDRDRLAMSVSSKQIEISTTGSYAEVLLVPRHQAVSCPGLPMCYDVTVFYVR